MAKHRPAEQPLRDHAPGYLPDGASEHSHKISKGHKMSSPLFRDRPPEQQPRHHGDRWRTLSELIGKNKNELKKLEAKLAGTLNPADRANIESDLDVKAAFLARLLAEQDERGIGQ